MLYVCTPELYSAATNLGVNRVIPWTLGLNEFGLRLEGWIIAKVPVPFFSLDFGFGTSNWELGLGLGLDNNSPFPCEFLLKTQSCLEFSAKYSALILGFCGMAPLHFVARYGSKLKDTKESLTFLMHCMDNPLQEDEFGNTVLHHAILNQSESIR